MSAIHAALAVPTCQPVRTDTESRVTEILLHNSSVCLQPVLLPMIAGLSHKQRWLVLINPPQDINRAALEQAGACTRHILVLGCSTPAQTEIVCSRALAAGTCHTVITWCDGGVTPELERLNHCAALGDSLGILVRT